MRSKIEIITLIIISNCVNLINNLDPYEVLNLPLNRTLKQIKERYKEYTGKHNPDIHINSPDYEIFKNKHSEIKQAYETLKEQRKTEDDDEDYEYDHNINIIIFIVLGIYAFAIIKSCVLNSLCWIIEKIIYQLGFPID